TVVAADSHTVSQITPRYWGAVTLRKLARVKPPVWSEPGMNSRTLYWNRHPRATAKSAMTARAGASRSFTPSLLDDIAREPLTPPGQVLGAHLVVDDVALLLPLRGRDEYTRLPREVGGHRRADHRGARLERLDQLGLDVLGDGRVDELVRSVGLLRPRHDGHGVDADHPGIVRGLHELHRDALVDQVVRVHGEHHLHRRLARLHQVLALRVRGEEGGDLRLELHELLLPLLPRGLVAAFHERGDGDDV